MCYGRSDVPLAVSFPEEAAAVREALHGVRFDGVWSSPLSRCVRLAEVCGWGGAWLDERLLEINFGEWEGRLFDEIADPRLQLWYSDYLNVRPTGGESFPEQCARVASFLEELRSGAYRRALIFTHGGVMLAAGIGAGLFTPVEAFSGIPTYGSILKFEIAR
jgi:alpha-ribazole phosphatase